MRIRGGHIAGLVVAAIFAFIAFAVLTLPEAPPPEPDPDGAVGQTIPPPFTWSDTENTTTPEDIERMTAGIGSLPPAGMSDELAGIIEVETEHLDVGVVPNDAPSHHALKVRNRGKLPLKISKINTTCACTQGHIANGTIPPGGEAEIDVVIDPMRIGGFESTKTLTIFSNDPKHGTVEVDVTAHVDPEYEIVPDPADFGAIQKDSDRPLELIIRQLEDDAPLEVTAAGTLDRLLADTPLDDLRVEVEPVPAEDSAAPGKNEYVIRIFPTPDLPPGVFFRRIAIKTNVDRLQGFPAELTVRGVVEAPYTVKPVYPDRLVIRAGNDTPAVLTVTAAETVEIGNLDFDTEQLAVTVRNEGNTAYIDVTAAPNAPTGRIEAELRFTVQVGGEEYPERVGVLRTFAG